MQLRILPPPYHKKFTACRNKGPPAPYSKPHSKAIKANAYHIYTLSANSHKPPTVFTVTPDPWHKTPTSTPRTDALFFPSNHCNQPENVNLAMSPKPPKRNINPDAKAKPETNVVEPEPSPTMRTDIRAAIDSPALGKKPSPSSHTDVKAAISAPSLRSKKKPAPSLHADINAANKDNAAVAQSDHPYPDDHPVKHHHKHARSSKSKNSSPASTSSDLTTWAHLFVDRSGATIRTLCTQDCEDGQACQHAGKERRYAGIPRVDEPAVKITIEGVKAMEVSDEWKEKAKDGENGGEEDEWVVV